MGHLWATIEHQEKLKFCKTTNIINLILKGVKISLRKVC